LINASHIIHFIYFPDLAKPVWGALGPAVESIQGGRLDSMEGRMQSLWSRTNEHLRNGRQRRYPFTSSTTQAEMSPKTLPFEVPMRLGTVNASSLLTVPAISMSQVGLELPAVAVSAACFGV